MEVESGREKKAMIVFKKSRERPHLGPASGGVGLPDILQGRMEAAGGVSGLGWWFLDWRVILTPS